MLSVAGNLSLQTSDPKENQICSSRPSLRCSLWIGIIQVNEEVAEDVPTLKKRFLLRDAMPAPGHSYNVRLQFCGRHLKNTSSACQHKKQEVRRQIQSKTPRGLTNGNPDLVV